MQITVETKWGFICSACGHNADSHTGSHCEKEVRTDYEDSMMGFMGPRKVTARIICDCTQLKLLRVKMSVREEKE